MSTRCSILIVTFSALILQGCATPVFEPEVARDIVGKLPPIWSSAADSHAVEAGWVSSFDDEVLSALVLEAQQHNRELQGLAAGVKQANALTRQAGAALLPSIGLDVSADRQSDQGFTEDAKKSNVQASWEIDLWGRLSSETQAAKEDARAVRADYRFAQHSLAAAVARAYFAAIGSAIQTDIVNRSVESLERIYKVVQLQEREGVVSAQDLAVTRSDLFATRSQLVESKGAKRDALRALELLLGRYPSAEIELRDTLPTTSSAPGAGLPSDILERRPDIMAAERRIAAAFQRVNVARTAHLPRLSLTTSFGGAASELSSLLDRANRAWSIDGSLLAPIFQSGALKAQVELASAEQRAAIAAYGQAAFNGFSEVESSLDAGTILLQQVSDLSSALAAASEAYRIAKVRFDEGDMNLFDLLSVEQRTFERHIALNRVQLAVLEQRVNLYLALGGSWG
jgi:NodT family efflux transporter outer membrane factor (OMF) lipoprotein